MIPQHHLPVPAGQKRMDPAEDSPAHARIQPALQKDTMVEGMEAYLFTQFN